MRASSPSKRPSASSAATAILALPKGRLLDEALPLLRRAGIDIEPAFADAASRQLRFATNWPGLEIVRVRSFDVATYVAFGAAHLGVVGSDVLAEFDYGELYAPLDLGIGRCRLSIAEPARLSASDDLGRSSHIRIATKYPNVTRRHFAARGIQVECVNLSGAMELAPQLGLCTRIVDLVQTGSTLKANGLAEVETILEVSARLVVNRAALKTQPALIGQLIDRLREVILAP